MKKINVFAAVSTAMLTMAFGMTSCNDNDDLKQLEHVEVTAEELVDSVFVNDFTYAYDQTGTDSDKDFVPDINIGIEQNTPPYTWSKRCWQYGIEYP